MSGWSCLEALPDSLFHLPKLNTLDLGNRSSLSPLADVPLPDAIGALTTLETLNLQMWTNLRTLPDAIGQLCALRSLDLSGCGIITGFDLPEAIGQLTCLEYLNLGHASGNSVHLGGMSEVIAQRFAKLPESIGQLTSLKYLDLTMSGLLVLPESVGRLPALQNLVMTSCLRLEALCETLPPRLEGLSLANCSELRRVPDALGGLARLSHLDLRNCMELTSLPPFGGLTELKQLCLVGCGGIEVMPEGLNRLVGCCVEFDDGDVIVGQ